MNLLVNPSHRFAGSPIPGQTARDPSFGPKAAFWSNMMHWGSYRGMFLLAGLALLACDPPDGSGMDAGTDASTDGGMAAGLAFDFVSEPEVPGSVGGSYAAEIAEVRITLGSIRAVGDAAPGGEETFQSELALIWPPNGTSLVFPEAPFGLYSFLRADIESVEIEGTVIVDMDTHTYRIVDAPLRQVTVELEDVELGADASETVEIRVDLEDVIKDVDWDAVAPNGQGILIVDSSSPQIQDLRDRLEEAFEHEHDES